MQLPVRRYSNWQWRTKAASIQMLPSKVRLMMLTLMSKPSAKTNVERTPAGLQMILPGCERRTLPKSTSRVDEGGQGLLHFYQPPSLREQLETRSEAPLRASRGQKAMPRSGLFGS